jgi:hypothetical protein
LVTSGKAADAVVTALPVDRVLSGGANDHVIARGSVDQA